MPIVVAREVLQYSYGFCENGVAAGVLTRSGDPLINLKSSVLGLNAFTGNLKLTTYNSASIALQLTARWLQRERNHSLF